MSYDILAFDPSAAPSNDADMATWYGEQTDWSDQLTYDDLSVTTPALRAFYRDLIKAFPPFNGPDALADDDDADTDYSIGPGFIYVTFRWGKADQARETFLKLSRAHGVGVYEVSHNPAAIHRPTGAVNATSSATGTAATHASAPGPVTGQAETAASPAESDAEKKGEGRLYL